MKKCEGLPLTFEVVGQLSRGRHEEEDWKQVLDAVGKAEAVMVLMRVCGKGLFATTGLKRMRSKYF